MPNAPNAPNAPNSQPSSLDRAWSAIAAVLSFLIALIAYLWGRLTGIPGTSSTIDYLEGLRPLLLEMERSVNQYGIQLTDETLYNYNQLEERRQRCRFRMENLRAELQDHRLPYPFYADLRDEVADVCEECKVLEAGKEAALKEINAHLKHNPLPVFRPPSPSPPPSP